MHKKFLISILGLTGLFTAGIPDNASAQFLKKLFQKERRQQQTSPPPAGQVPDSRAYDPVYPPTEFKERYRIDVLVPLYMDELVRDNTTSFKNRIPVKALAGTGFYEGLKLAADSMDSSKYKIDVYVHDITSGTGSVEKLISGGALKKSDLLLGAVHSTQVEALADFARKQHINFVSTLSPSDGNAEGNPFFTLLQPTLRTHCEYIQKTVFSKYPRRKLFIYKYDSPIGMTAFDLVTGKQQRKFDIIPCAGETPDPALLSTVLDSSGTNVVIIPVMETGKARALLLQLHTGFPDHRFEIFGMPSWNEPALLKEIAGYSNMAVSFTSYTYYDPQTPAGRKIAQRYSQVYGGKPHDFVFQGYEVFYWYATLLQKYGTIFNADLPDNSASLFTGYEIRPARNAEGTFLYHENRRLFLYRYFHTGFTVE